MHLDEDLSTERGMFRAIEIDLTDAFILMEYADQVGIMDTAFKDKAIEKYRNDPVYLNRVKSLVTGVMQIVTKHAYRAYKERSQGLE
jgi:hypothetical protein